MTAFDHPGVGDRILTVQKKLTEGSRLTVSEAAELISADRSSAYRILKKLEEYGFAQKQGRYYYGTMQPLLSVCPEKTPYTVAEASGPLLESLVEQTGISAHLCMLTGGGATFIRQEFSSDVVNVIQKIGGVEPLYCTASGKVLLAFLPETMRTQLLSSLRFIRYTERTIVTPEALDRELSATAARGYALDNGEYHPGVCCICVPIFDRFHIPRYALGLSRPVQDGKMYDYLPYRPLLQKCAEKLSAFLSVSTAQMSNLSVQK